MDAEPRVSIIVLAHQRAHTIDLSIESALHQTIEDLEVIVLGDGCDDATRRVIERFWRTDDRVRFMDLPKGPGRGEAYRADAVGAARAPIVGYLCDDELLFPDHVADMIKLLEDAEIAISSRGAFRPDGTFDAAAEAGLTGVFHRKGFVASGDAILDLARGLDPRVVSSDRVTTVRISNAVRCDWTPADRRAELLAWADRIALPGERALVDAEVARGLQRRLTEVERALAGAQASSSGPDVQWPRDRQPQALRRRWWQFRATRTRGEVQ